MLGNMNKHINTHKTQIEKPTRKSQGPARILPQSIVSFFVVVIYESPRFLWLQAMMSASCALKSDHVKKQCPVHKLKGFWNKCDDMAKKESTSLLTAIFFFTQAKNSSSFFPLAPGPD